MSKLVEWILHCIRNSNINSIFDVWSYVPVLSTLSIWASATIIFLHFFKFLRTTLSRFKKRDSAITTLLLTLTGFLTSGYILDSYWLEHIDYLRVRAIYYLEIDQSVCRNVVEPFYAFFISICFAQVQIIAEHIEQNCLPWRGIRVAVVNETTDDARKAGESEISNNNRVLDNHYCYLSEKIDYGLKPALTY